MRAFDINPAVQRALTDSTTYEADCSSHQDGVHTQTPTGYSLLMGSGYRRQILGSKSSCKVRILSPVILHQTVNSDLSILRQFQFLAGKYKAVRVCASRHLDLQISRMKIRVF